MSDTATDIHVGVKPLDPARDGDAAGLLARCPALGTTERAAAEIAAARLDEGASVIGLLAGEQLAAVYLLQKAHLSNEVRHLAVAAGAERRGYGKMCLYDALLRSGKRPLVVEADEATFPFYKRVGFKLVGKRKAADGSARFRLGWHAPMPKPGSPDEVIC